MGSRATEKDLDYKKCLATGGDHLDIGNKAWSDGVGDQIAEAFFLRQRVRDAHHLFVVRHSDDESPARGIGKGDQGLEQRSG